MGVGTVQETIASEEKAMKKSRITLAVAALSTVALALSACGNASNSNSGSSASGSSSSSTTKTITANGCEPQNPLLPANTNETCGGDVVDLINAMLVAFDNKGNAHNNIAKSITASNGNKTYTVVLKNGWTFSDGSPIKASNFTRAWSYAANATNAQVNSSFFSNIAGFDDLQKKGTDKNAQLSGLKVDNDHQFTVNLAQPSSVFPIQVGYPAFAPLPDSFFTGSVKAYGEHPLSSGPYTLKSFTHNQSMVLVKNPRYHGFMPAKNGGITFRIYTDPEAAYSDVEAGNLDVMDTIPPSALKTFKTDSSIQAYSKPGSTFQSFTFAENLKHFTLNSQEGRLRRQAVSMAVDRKAITTKVLSGTATPATDFIAPTIPGHSTTLKNRSLLSYNPSRARQLWAQANKISPWSSSDTLHFYYNADGGGKPVFDAIANSVKNTLHINASSDAVATFSQFRTQITSGKIDGAFRTGWMPDYPAAQDYLYPLYATASGHGNGSNDGNYSNASVDRLFSQADQASSVAAANKLYQQAEETLLQDMAAVPLYYGNANGAAAKGVKGFTMNWQNEPVYQNLTK